MSPEMKEFSAQASVRQFQDVKAAKMGFLCSAFSHI